MTEFKTDISENGKKFELVFQTDNKAYFEKMQATARECIDHKPVTQFDCIKAMNIDEMADCFSKFTQCDDCPARDFCNKINSRDDDLVMMSCSQRFKQWLESEVSE